MIAVATLTACRRIFYGDTSSVPNGTYTMHCAATDPAGSVGISAGITITVHN